MSVLPDYFGILGLTPAFNIDLQALETSYFTQQRLYHPDRFVGKPDSERREALGRSVDINTAYNMLRNPLARAQYLLHLQGIAVGTEHDNIKPSSRLLEETMEWREKIDAVQGAKEIEGLNSELNSMYTQSLQTIAQAFSENAWDRMAHETLRLGYLIKSQEAIVMQKTRRGKSAL